MKVLEIKNEKGLLTATIKIEPREFAASLREAYLDNADRFAVPGFAAGLAPLAWGLPFLTSGHATPELPLVGPVPLASAMVFDAGVCLVVFGASMQILSSLGGIRPSLTRTSWSANIRRPDPARSRGRRA